jgi:carbohydrate-binding DOMON domain-containing protein
VQTEGELQVRQLLGQYQHRFKVVFRYVPSRHFWQIPLPQLIQAKEMEAQASVGMQRLNSRAKPVSQALQVSPRQEEQ